MIFCLGVIAAFIAILAIPATREVFITASTNHPYLMAFVKFALLATVGDILGKYLGSKQWAAPKGAVQKAIVWGFLGMVITLMFQIFIGGVNGAMANGYLMQSDSVVLHAFLASVFMNFAFAPTFMAFHRITDTLIDLKCDGVTGMSLSEVLKSIDWSGFITFVVMKTIPFFWVPAHTLSFLCPGEYRVVFAASLSVALGAILGFATKKK